MIQQFTDLSQIASNTTKGKKKSTQKPTEINISLLFKINNCANISAIDHNKEDIITSKGFD